MSFQFNDIQETEAFVRSLLRNAASDTDDPVLNEEDPSSSSPTRKDLNPQSSLANAVAYHLLKEENNPTITLEKNPEDRKPLFRDHSVLLSWSLEQSADLTPDITFQDKGNEESQKRLFTAREVAILDEAAKAFKRNRKQNAKVYLCL